MRRQTGALATLPPNEPHARSGRAGAGARWAGPNGALLFRGERPGDQFVRRLVRIEQSPRLLGAG